MKKISKTVKDVLKYDDEEEILEKKQKNKELREKRKIRIVHENGEDVVAPLHPKKEGAS